MNEIQSEIIRVLKEHSFDKVQFNLPPKQDLGDFSSAIAMSESKKNNENPMVLAEKIKTILYGKIKHISQITISEPGYINFFVDYATFGQELIDNIIKNGFAIAMRKTTQKVSVEHTSVNPNKAMHIGHLRNSILGDIIANLFQRTGHQTETINYLDDTGVQVADTITALLYLDEPKYNDSEKFDEIWVKWDEQKESFDYYCWNIYAKFSQEIEKGNDFLISKRQEVSSSIEKGNNPIADFGKSVAEKIVTAHLHTLARLGINFDLLVWESDIVQSGLWQKSFELLKQKNIAIFETDGKNKDCWIIKADGDQKTEKEDFSKDKILVKSNGSLTYTAKDLAYQLWKLGKIKADFKFAPFEAIESTSLKGSENSSLGNADKIINVIDFRQTYPQQIIKASLKKLGYLPDDNDYYHLDYGVVNLTEKAAEKIGIHQGAKNLSMSGRKGIGIKADDLIAIIIEEINKKSQNSEISKKLANAAIRFYMSKFSRNQDINFDFDAALQAVGESGIYLSYCYARAINILKKSAYQQESFKLDKLSQSEKKLISKMAELEKVIDSAVYNLEPSEISRFAFELCSTFSDFYENTEPIYKAEGNIKNFRLAIVKSFTIILRELLLIIGIEPLEKI